MSHGARLTHGFRCDPVSLSIRSFPLGSARNAFAALTSLLPGTVPSGDEGSRLIYHCLDVDQPVVSQLAAEEAALRHAIRHD
jgi:multicomponent Na+:H+ antiporter subunit E